MHTSICTLVHALPAQRETSFHLTIRWVPCLAVAHLMGVSVPLSYAGDRILGRAKTSRLASRAWSPCQEEFQASNTGVRPEPGPNKPIPWWRVRLRIERFYTPPSPGSDLWDCSCARIETEASIQRPLWVVVVVYRIGFPRYDFWSHVKNTVCPATCS